MKGVKGCRLVAGNVGATDGSHARAGAAGPKEHSGPTESPGMPRHSRFEDPSRNRVVRRQA
jgi:hypothetical protein